MPRAVLTGTQAMEGLIEAGRRLGYIVHHETDSRRTERGFPDLVIVGHGRLFVFETKTPGEPFRAGRLTKAGESTPGQFDWLCALAALPAECLMVAVVVASKHEKKVRHPNGLWWMSYDDALAELNAARSIALAG